MMMCARPLSIATLLLSIASCVDTGDEADVDESTTESAIVPCCDGGGGGGGGGSSPGPRPTPPPGASEAAAPMTPDADQHVTDAAIAAGSGCSVVQYCNAPGEWGTVCLHLTCDYNTAYNECIRESYNVCGTPVQPWIFVCRNSTCT